MKKSILTSLSLFLLFSMQSSPSFSAETIVSSSLTVFLTENGAPVVSSAGGKAIQVAIFLADAKDPGISKTAKPVTLSFTPMNAYLAASAQTVLLQGNKTRITGGVSTLSYYGVAPFTPSSSGILKINFAGDNEYSPASFVRYIDVWTPQTRTTSDQVDQLKGFQVHAVYVIPSDATDAGRDTSGQISSWLLQGARWLDRETGDHWRYDTFNSVADVTYFKSSYPSSVLTDSTQNAASKLLKEMGKYLPSGANRKTYLFFLEVQALRTLPGEKDALCGLANPEPSRTVLIAANNTPLLSSCGGYVDIMDWQALVAVHETIHSLGVGHVATPTDIMTKVPDNTGNITIDRPKTEYFGSSNSGTNIKSLPIWSRSTGVSTTWPCIFEQENNLYLCKTGKTVNVEAYPANCWQLPNQSLKFQMKSGSKWITAPKPQGSKFRIAKTLSCSASFPVSYSMTLSSGKTGTYTYRFIAQGWTGKSFSVIYQN